jgi:hypothetical protein
MTHKIYIWTFAIGLLSCNNQATDTTATSTTIDRLQTISTQKQKPDIDLQDKPQYDQGFLDGLSEYNEPIELIDNYILVGKDTIYFPEDIQLNKETVFKGTKDQNNYVLTATRINLTSMTYNFQLSSSDNKIIASKSGKATLGSLFFIGSETDEDDKSGESYLSVEYWDNSSDCSFAIRVGKKNSTGKLRAKIKLYCKGNKSKNIDLGDNPTMRTE